MPVNLILLKFVSAFLALGFWLNTGEIDLHIIGAKSDRGVVRILVFDSEKGFPDKPEFAVKSLSLPVSDRKSNVKISGLPPGNYAIAVMHDEDENGVLNTNPVGYPTEKYGFSTNPKIYFGPPSFEKVTFQVTGEVKHLRIQLR